MVAPPLERRRATGTVWAQKHVLQAQKNRVKEDVIDKIVGVGTNLFGLG